LTQILGQLIYDNPDKVEKTLKTFQEAARRREEDADMWELLAELLAPRDPLGGGMHELGQGL
jgi:ABC-type nitrate/sulfonate/bicarbonate transport system substrate-binding protein